MCVCVCVCVCERERERERGREREVKAVNNTLVPKAQLGVRCISISEIIVSTHIHTHTHTCMHAHTHTHTHKNTHTHTTHTRLHKKSFIQLIFFNHAWFSFIIQGKCTCTDSEYKCTQMLHLQPLVQRQFEHYGNSTKKSEQKPIHMERNLVFLNN